MEETVSFGILNDSNSILEIIHEPEGFQFDLPVNEEITIKTHSILNSILLKISLIDEKIVLSILDNQSHYSVIYKNEDVFF